MITPADEIKDMVAELCKEAAEARKAVASAGMEVVGALKDSEKACEEAEKAVKALEAAEKVADAADKMIARSHIDPSKFTAVSEAMITLAPKLSPRKPGWIDAVHNAIAEARKAKADSRKKAQKAKADARKKAQKALEDARKASEKAVGEAEKAAKAAGAALDKRTGRSHRGHKNAASRADQVTMTAVVPFAIMAALVAA